MNHRPKSPGELLEISGSYWRACTLHAGVKLDLFTLLGDRALTVEQLQERLRADADGLERLLNALAAMGLLVKEGQGFANTEASRKYLDSNSGQAVNHLIMHHHHLAPSWARLDESVRTGKPIHEPVPELDEERRKSFLLGMAASAMLMAPQLVAGIDLGSSRHMLDLGGGPGTYAVHFCLHNPGLRATVLDLPASRPYAEKTIVDFGLENRVGFVPGDYVHEEVQGSYDVVWMSHILHGESPQDCESIVAKAVRVLATGGQILLHDFILEDTGDDPPFPALFSLNMLVATEGGRAYTQTELESMLRRAGVGDVRRLDVQGPNQSGVLAGRT
jgi:SAM-dependent methyltransferase